jgi:hypothetical protein
MKLEEIQKEILKINLGNARMTDVVNGTYQVFSPEGEDKVFIVNEEKHKVGVTFASLAAARIAVDPTAAAKLKTTRDARDSDAIISLKAGIESEKITFDDNLKLKVVHRLHIMDSVTGKKVYKNDCYEGYPTYVKSAREASLLPTDTEEQRLARNNAYTNASEALRKTDLKSGVTETAKYLLQMPVFQVTTE